MAPPASPQPWPTSPVQLRYALKHRNSSSISVNELDEIRDLSPRKDNSGIVRSTVTVLNGRAPQERIAESPTDEKPQGTILLNEPKPPSDVTFEIAGHALTSWGDHIYIVGDIPELGEWDPERAIKLSSDSYPLWTARITLPAHTKFEYKYIRKTPGQSVAWEDTAFVNRVVRTPPSGSLQVHDSWY